MGLPQGVATRLFSKLHWTTLLKYLQPGKTESTTGVGSQVTYGMVDGGDSGEVVQRQLDVLASRYTDQPRTPTTAVTTLASSPRRQVATGARHQYLTFVTPVGLTCRRRRRRRRRPRCTGHCTRTFNASRRCIPSLCMIP